MICHYVYGWNPTACGRFFNVWTMAGTGDRNQVTCKNCLKALEREKAREE